MTTEPTLEQLDRLVGAWTTEMTHPSLPGVVVHGTADIEWLEGERFLIQRARSDHPDFPDSISVIGDTGRDRVDTAADTEASAGVSMHYFDSRGVFRVYGVSIDSAALRIARNAPEFSQRFTGTFADGDRTIDGLWELSRDGVTWNDDLQITYRR